jgi:hypothetical protein
MLRTFAGGFGIVVFVAALVVGALAATGIVSDASESFAVGGSESHIVPATKKSEPETQYIGETVRAGDLTWTVHEARRTPEVRGFTFPPDPLEGDLLVVTFAVENDSDGPITIGPESMVLVDDKGLESPPAASVNTEYVVPAKAILFNERGLLDPGEMEEGKVVYDLEVPFGVDPTADLSGFHLRLGDGDPTVAGEKRVDLGL